MTGRGRISLLGLTQDIIIGRCVFKCDVPHQLTEQQVCPVSVYCDRIGGHVAI